jgi:hypothetical protein
VLALATLALRVRDPRHAAVLATGSGA